MDQRDIYLEDTGNSYSKTFIMYFLPQKNMRHVLQFFEQNSHVVYFTCFLLGKKKIPHHPRL